jgi:hypothetical protein
MKWIEAKVVFDAEDIHLAGELISNLKKILQLNPLKAGRRIRLVVRVGMRLSVIFQKTGRSKTAARFWKRDWPY